jgi:hypothetical protein
MAITHISFGKKNVLVAKENLGKLLQISHIIVHDEILEMWLMKLLTWHNPWQWDCVSDLAKNTDILKVFHFLLCMSIGRVLF